MKIINSLLILVLIVSPLSVWAESPMEQAQAAEQASLELARSKATEAVTGDFNFAISQVMSGIANKPDAAALYAVTIEKQADLLAQLSKIESLDATELSQVKANALAALEKYKDLARQKFDLSFQQAEIRENERESLRMAILALQQFKSNCGSGKGIGGLGETAFRYPELPKPDVGFYIGTNSADAHYNGTGSTSEKDRNTAIGVTEFIASNVVVAAYVPGAASASTAAMCATAAPYTLGAGVAVAAVMLYMNAQERVKMETEISDAKTYAFHHMANDKIIGQFYREQCQDLSDRTQPLIDAFNTAVNSPDELEAYAGNESFVADMNQLNAILKEREQLLAQLAALKNKQDSSSAQAMQDLASRLTDLERQIAQLSSPDHVAKMAVQVLISQRDGLTQKMNQAASSNLDLAQKRAFAKVLNIIELVQQKEFSKFLSGSDEIAQEISANRNFISARILFKKTLASQIKFIFGHLSAQELKQTQSQLATATRELITSYPRAKDIRNFAVQVTQLIGSI